MEVPNLAQTIHHEVQMSSKLLKPATTKLKLAQTSHGNVQFNSIQPPWSLKYLKPATTKIRSAQTSH
jgi:hypothetical protein